MRQPLCFAKGLAFVVETEIMTVESLCPVDVGDAMKHQKRVSRRTAYSPPSGTAIAEWPPSAVATRATASREPTCCGARAGHAVGGSQPADGRPKSDLQIPTSPSVPVSPFERPGDRENPTTSIPLASATCRSPVAAGRYFTGPTPGEHLLTPVERPSKTQPWDGNGDTVGSAFAPSNEFRNQQNPPNGSCLAAIVTTKTDIVAGASGVTPRILSPNRCVAVSASTTTPRCPDRRLLF